MSESGSDDDAILRANRAFYAAMDRGDLAAMADLWSETVPVTCVHPGDAVLSGRSTVLASWKEIFAGGGTRGIRCHDATVLRQGDMALVVGYEALGGGFLAAVNAFVREGPVWKMVHHQAGPTRGAPKASAPQAPTVH